MTLYGKKTIEGSLPRSGTGRGTASGRRAIPFGGSQVSGRCGVVGVPSALPSLGCNGRGTGHCAPTLVSFPPRDGRGRPPYLPYFFGQPQRVAPTDVGENSGANL
jgi:hypothetical protein